MFFLKKNQNSYLFLFVLTQKETKKSRRFNSTHGQRSYHEAPSLRTRLRMKICIQRKMVLRKEVGKLEYRILKHERSATTEDYNHGKLFGRAGNAHSIQAGSSVAVGLEFILSR